MRDKTFNMRGSRFYYKKELTKIKTKTKKKYLFHFTKFKTFLIPADNLVEAKKKLRKTLVELKK